MNCIQLMTIDCAYKENGRVELRPCTEAVLHMNKIEFDLKYGF